MCHAVTCKQCGKTTWAGCGQHVAAVKSSVPAAQWCGHVAQPSSTGGGLLARIFGR
ncbi:MAG: hypothetical protein IPL41_02095 [Micropruina sp.]|nr:hypothetical protein [Micropruina sp.]